MGSDHEREPHPDDRTADPRGPGGEKTENLRRIERQREEQRRRVREAQEPADEREGEGPLS